MLPPNFDPAAATMMTTWRETLSYLIRLGFKSGASVLVVGSGGNGLSFAAHAAILGASRVAMIGSSVRAGNARAVGVTDFFDRRAGNLDSAVKATCPEGFDFIVDAVGQRSSLDDALPYVRSGGIVDTFGGIDEYGAWQINPGRARGSFTFAKAGYDEAETHEQVIALVQQGKLDARIWLDLDHPYPLDDIAEAFAALNRRELVSPTNETRAGFHFQIGAST